MYRLQVWFGRHWKWGINTYDNLDEANARLNELKNVGIKARIRNNSEFVN